MAGRRASRFWSQEEDAALREAVRQAGKGCSTKPLEVVTVWSRGGPFVFLAILFK